MLVDHAEAAAGQRQREDRDDRRAGPQRQRRQRRRRRRRTVEEVDVDRVGGLDVLIDQDRDRLVRVERAQHAADRAAPVDHRVAGARRARARAVVQERVVERPRQHRHRLQRQRVHERVDLPEAEVPGEEQHALALRVRARRRAPRLRTRRARSICAGRHRAELQQHRQQPAEVREHAARDGAALALRAQRKRRAAGCASPAAGARRRSA